MQQPSRRGVVYVVETDAAVREGLTRLLDSAGLDVLPCATVADFLAQAQGEVAGCALFDVRDARHAEAAVHAALRAVARRLPVIALSSSDEPATRRLARELGARAFFRKPVDAAALLDAIEWATLGA